MCNRNNNLHSAYRPILTDEEFFLAKKPSVLQLCIDTFLNWTPNRIQIEHMKGGSYNRIMALNILLPPLPKFSNEWVAARLPNPLGTQKEERSVQKEELEQFIIRIPRFGLLGYGMGYNIAILQFARSCLSSPVARLLSFDLSAENAPGDPYTIQERLQGQNLDDIITTLNLAQLKCLTLQVMSCLEEMRGITSTSAGVLRPTTTDTSTKVRLDKFMVPPRTKIEYRGFSKPSTSPAIP